MIGKEQYKEYDFYLRTALSNQISNGCTYTYSLHPGKLSVTFFSFSVKCFQTLFLCFLKANLDV